MTISTDQAANEIAALADEIRSAGDAGSPLRIVGGDTKSFYGGRPTGNPISSASLTGIISYDPTELVVQVRAGTRLSQLIGELSDNGQMLPFEPPHFGEGATVGGMVATGLSGPRRPFAGSVRDYVLGVGLISGRAEYLEFGGQVMKNVAGYDVSRLATGSLGTLGLITEASFKVLPIPAVSRTLCLDNLDAQAAIDLMNAWAGSSLPISAACHLNQTLQVRLEGALTAVDAASADLGGRVNDDHLGFWDDLRELRLPEFGAASRPLWRLSVPPATPHLALPGNWIVDWGGAQRWLSDCDASIDDVRAVAKAAGGHATIFRSAADRSQVFTPLESGIQKLHANLKTAFDPRGLFNPGRLYAEL